MCDHLNEVGHVNDDGDDDDEHDGNVVAQSIVSVTGRLILGQVGLDKNLLAKHGDGDSDDGYNPEEGCVTYKGRRTSYRHHQTGMTGHQSTRIDDLQRRACTLGHKSK